VVKLNNSNIKGVERAQRMALGENRDHPWKGMSSIEIMQSAGLYDEDWRTGKKGFNLACILLFGKDDVIRSCAPGFETDALVRRKNIDRYDDRLIVGTNLIEAYDKLADFIAKHTLDRFFLVDNQRVSVRSWIARELVSNILAHREYSKGFPAKIVIESDRIYAENWNRSNRYGRIDPKDFTPDPKNPIISRFFVNIGRADKLGSGVRNLYKYTKIYSGGEPELIEGDIFKTIVPLRGVGATGFTGYASETHVAEMLPNRLADILPNNIAERLTPAESVFLNSLMPFFDGSIWITNAQARAATGKSDGSVKRFMRNLTDKGAIESRGETRDRQYRLALRGNQY
jgi:ATP-dependent DNA helicase RecG